MKIGDKIFCNNSEEMMNRAFDLFVRGFNAVFESRNVLVITELPQ